MAALTLKERMVQVTDWLGSTAIRPLSEEDYARAHTYPMSWKRAFDGLTLGTTYASRHSRRSIAKGDIAKGVAQALPVPVLGLTALSCVPIGTCFIQRLEQKRVRSKDATLEDTIAFELRNARLVADTLARDDQVEMLQHVYGTPRSDVVAWATTCVSLAQKLNKDVSSSCERVRESRLIRHQMKKMITSIDKVRSRYGT